AFRAAAPPALLARPLCAQAAGFSGGRGGLPAHAQRASVHRHERCGAGARDRGAEGLPAMTPARLAASPWPWFGWSARAWARPWRAFVRDFAGWQGECGVELG